MRQEEITLAAQRRAWTAAGLRYDGLLFREIGKKMGTGIARARKLVKYGERTMGNYFNDLNEYAELINRYFVVSDPSENK